MLWRTVHICVLLKCVSKQVITVFNIESVCFKLQYHCVWHICLLITPGTVWGKLFQGFGVWGFHAKGYMLWQRQGLRIFFLRHWHTLSSIRLPFPQLWTPQSSTMKSLANLSKGIHLNSNKQAWSERRLFNRPLQQCFITIGWKINKRLRLSSNWFPKTAEIHIRANTCT